MLPCLWETTRACVCVSPPPDCLPLQAARSPGNGGPPAVSVALALMGGRGWGVVEGGCGEHSFSFSFQFRFSLTHSLTHTHTHTHTDTHSHIETPRPPPLIRMSPVRSSSTCMMLALRLTFFLLSLPSLLRFPFLPRLSGPSTTTNIITTISHDIVTAPLSQLRISTDDVLTTTSITARKHHHRRHHPHLVFFASASPLVYLQDITATSTTPTTPTNTTSTTTQDSRTARRPRPRPRRSIYDAYFTGGGGGGNSTGGGAGGENNNGGDERFLRFADRLFQGLDTDNDGSLQAWELQLGVDQAKRKGAVPATWNITMAAFHQHHRQQQPNADGR